MAEYDTLTRNQKKAIPALLQAKTIAEAAAAAGLGERTLYRYLRDDTFRAALARAESDAINTAARRLVAGSAEALDTLHALMTSAERENVRRLAASHWLDSVLRWAELVQLEQRLSALEETHGT